MVHLLFSNILLVDSHEYFTIFDASLLNKAYVVIWTFPFFYLYMVYECPLTLMGMADAVFPLVRSKVSSFKIQTVVDPPSQSLIISRLFMLFKFIKSLVGSISCRDQCFRKLLLAL